MTKIETVKKKISENKTVCKAKKFCHENKDVVACMVGAAIGGWIVGCMWAEDRVRCYNKGYSEGYTKGGDGLLDDMWLGAAWNGGKSDTVYRNNDGYRLGVHCETLPPR